MALTKVSRGLLSTGIVDNSNATAITLNADESATFSGGVDVTGTATMGGLTVDGNDSYTSNIKFDYGASAPTYFANWGYKSSSDGNKVFLTITDGGAAKDVLVANYNGNVGIGCSPNAALDVTVSASGIAQYVTNTSSSQAYTAWGNSDNPAWSQDFNTPGGLLVGIDSDETAVIYQGGNKAMRFGTNATEAFRITAARDMYFGQTSGSAASVGHIMQANGIQFHTASGAGPLSLNRLSSHGTVATFQKDGAPYGYIGTGAGTFNINTESNISFTVLMAGAAKMEIAGANGSLYLYAQATGAGNADLRYATSTGRVTYDTSSRLVKAEIEDIPYGLNTVMALSPKRYQRTDSDNKLEVGFIADEVVEVVPELVGMMEKRFLTMNQEDTEVIAGSVEYNKMTAVLVKAIQEQQATIEALTQRIETLENN